jgi:hypothetical protein
LMLRAWGWLDVWGFGLRIFRFRAHVLGSEFMVRDLGFRAQSLWFRVQGAGYRS